jgi:sugar lactone lactonase YvrE
MGACAELLIAGENGIAKVLEHIDMPTGHTTCPCVGGPNMDWLFVISANGTKETGATEFGGSLFVTKVADKGLPESRFKDSL